MKRLIIISLVLVIIGMILGMIGLARAGDGGITEKACQKYCLEESGTILDAFTYCMNACLGRTVEAQIGEAVCNHKWRTGWAYALVYEAPDCPESNPPTMRLRLEWCERCGILRMPENRRKMGREVRE